MLPLEVRLWEVAAAAETDDPVSVLAAVTGAAGKRLVAVATAAAAVGVAVGDGRRLATGWFYSACEAVTCSLCTDSTRSATFSVSINNPLTCHKFKLRFKKNKKIK